MAQMSDYLKDQLINHTFRATSYTTPTNVYVALYSSDPTSADSGTELSGSGYARVSASFGAPVAGSGTVLNDADITFAAATADWTAITHIGIRDALTGGNLLSFKALSSSVTVLNTNNFRIPTGQLTLIMS